jgi:hypothetical protein
MSDTVHHDSCVSGGKRGRVETRPVMLATIAGLAVYAAKVFILYPQTSKGNIGNKKTHE